MRSKIEVVLSDERLITPSGLCMVGQAMGKSNLIKKAARMKTDKRSQPQIKNGDILLAMIGMLTLRKCDFDYINEFHTDEEYYKMALGIVYGIPSEATLRMRLDAIGQTMAKFYPATKVSNNILKDNKLNPHYNSIALQTYFYILQNKP
ncbi:MAG: hypothetical protein NC452_13820 [Eubacterium sp.]|nr:hypothetical protein [Eubacterium sp.]